jgi:hypothetical protein
MPRMIRLHRDKDGAEVYYNPDHIVVVFPKDGCTGLTTVTGWGGTAVAESVAHVAALIEGSEFYQCDHCDYETDSEGAIARHYNTHPDTEEV